MTRKPVDPGTQERMAEAVRLVISRRERAPRSPRLERAFKRLIWRYSTGLRNRDSHVRDVQELQGITRRNRNSDRSYQAGGESNE